MPRSTVFQAESVTIDKTPFLAIVKYLRAESGELERAKGGLWVPLDGDVDKTLALLTNAAEQAMAFAVACESKHAEIIRASEPKAAAPKKAAKAPTPPPAAPKTPEREKIIAQARADRAKLASNGVAQVGATARDTGKPAAPKLSPEEEAEANWLRLLGA